MPPIHIARWLAGDRKLGPFVLRKPLGEGNYAPVWLAELRIGAGDPIRTAAVKLFAMGAASSAEDEASIAEAVIAEARALCKVQHPNVVQFFLPLIDEANGVIGLAMEYVAGKSLAAMLKDEPGGRLTPAMTIEIGIAIASALDAVHCAGLVHQDVKPDNIVAAGDVYKLIDFGIAAARGNATPGAGDRAAEQAFKQSIAENPPTRRVPGSWGTPGYIDPACVKGEPAGPASDLYALGATLYQCLAGKVPSLIRVEPGWEVDEAILRGEKLAPPLSDVATGGPPKLAQLVEELVAPSRQNRPRSAESVVIRLQQIKAEALGRKRTLPPEGPFRGLGRFETGDRDVYFGRGAEIAGAIDTVRSHGLTALVGPSGSGKSSLARAGILPAIVAEALGGWPKKWEVAVAEPGNDPRASVAAALSGAVRPEKGDALHAVLQEVGRSSTPDRLIDALAERARLAGVGLLVFVDQLEQLSAVPPEMRESRDWLVLLLARLAEHPLPGVRALVAIRHDRFDKVLAMPEIGRAAGRGMVQVEPMTTAAWRHVIDLAITTYGYRFEDDKLLDDIVAGVEPIADKMTLVQFALTEIWRRRDETKKLVTRRAFGLRSQERSAGIEGALDRYADSVLKEALKDPAIDEDAAQKFFVALTRPDETRETRTREQLVAEAGRAADVLIARFADAGLLERAPGDGYALAHDTLIRYWQRLHRWVEEIGEDRRLAQKLDEDARARKADPESTPLWIGDRLARGEALRARGRVKLTDAATTFLEESRRAVEEAVASQRAQEARERTLREEKEKARRARLRWLVVAAFAAVLAGGAVVYAKSRENHAREIDAKNQEIDAKNRELDTKNRELAATNQELDTTNQELDAKNRELNRLNKGLAQINEVLDGKNRDLRGARDRVERANEALRKINQEREEENKKTQIKLMLRDIPVIQ